MKPTPNIWTIPRTIRGYSASLLAQALTDLGLTQLPQGHATPVFIATGLFGTQETTNQLRRFLRKNDYDARRLKTQIHLPSKKGEPPYGKTFAQGVKERHINTGKKVHLIGWSLGGIVAKIYAQRHPEHVAGIYTLAAPYKDIKESTYLSYLQKPFSLIQRNPLSEELLEEIRQPAIVPHYSYVATKDEIVDPAQCESERTRYYPVGHLEIGFDPRVYAQIMQDISDNNNKPRTKQVIPTLTQTLAKLEEIITQ